jgi:SAM-dependent methyltransferase
MAASDTDKVFAGAVPGIYETFLVPMLFQSYAEDVVRRLAPRAPERVLEIAAGTGVVTRAMADGLRPPVEIVATDLNQAMVDQASSVGTSRPVEWRQADALALPFEDDSFDAVVVQFGVMFYPDKAKGHAEARRVLRRGGVYLFSVWDRIEENGVADAVTEALAAMFPDDPPRFLPRTPYGYHDPAPIERDLVAGGFAPPVPIDTIAFPCRAKTARDAALAFCQGSPLRTEIEARDATRLGEATDVAGAGVAKRYGDGPIESSIQAHVVTVEKR